MKQGKRERAMVFPDMKTTAGPCPVCVFALMSSEAEHGTSEL